MPRRGEHTKEELKALILKAAKNLVSTKGLKGLSARKLADKIGYTPGTIYNFYKNLDDLVMHINADTLDMLYLAMDQAIKNPDNPEKSIKEIANCYIEFSFKYYNYWSLLFDFQYKKQTKLATWYSEKIDRSFSLVEEPISHLVHKKQDIVDYSRVLWASLHGIATLSLRGKLDAVKATSAKTLSNLFAKNFISGLKA